jgi:hypothetical protein
MDIATVPYAKLDEQMNTLFMTINGRLGSIERGLNNPAIMTEPLKRQVKKGISDIHTRVMALNNVVNPSVAPVAAAAAPPMTPVRAPGPSSFFIHRTPGNMMTPVRPETPVYAGPYAPETPGSARKTRKTRKNRNKTIKIIKIIKKKK